MLSILKIAIHLNEELAQKKNLPSIHSYIQAKRDGT